MTPDCYYHPSGTTAVKHSHLFLLHDSLEKINMLNSTELIVLSKEVRRIGAAAENRTYIAMDYLSGCFLPTLWVPCTSRWMFIIIFVSLTSGWGLVLFWGQQPSGLCYRSNTPTCRWLTQLCVITVTITDKMTGR